MAFDLLVLPLDGGPRESKRGRLVVVPRESAVERVTKDELRIPGEDVTNGSG
jgi:hypothetical protein